MRQVAFIATALEAADDALAMAGRNLAGAAAEAPLTEVGVIDEQRRRIDSIRATLSDLARSNRDEHFRFALSSLTGSSELGEFPRRHR